MACNTSRPLSQVAATIGQAKDYAVFLAAAAGAGHSCVSSVSAAVSEVCHNKGVYSQPQQLHVGRQARPIGDKSSNASFRARDEQKA